MKRKGLLLVVLFTLFLLPTFVSAKTYSYTELRNTFNNIWPSVEAPIFKKGDIIEFTSSWQTRIYIEDEVDNDCYGNVSNCKTTYTFNDDSIITWITEDIYLFKVDENSKTIKFDDVVDGHVYKSGDIIINPSMFYDSFYSRNEDGTCDYISDFYYGQGNSCVLEGLSTKIPKYGNKDIMWKLTITDGGNYSPYYLFFEPYEYKAPTFKLTCDKQSISYGEKAKCSVKANSVYELKDVSFDLSTPNFKVSNAKETSDVTKATGNREFNFTVKNGASLVNKEFTLMTFDLEATKNEAYVDDISVIDILYTDEMYEGEYEMLKSDLKVIPNTSNPKTYRNTVLLLLPIILLIGTMITLKFRGEKKKKI